MPEKDAVYKCLNPEGIRRGPVDISPLAPRLTSLDGKTIYISMSGEAETVIALQKRLKRDYPDVNWKEKINRGPGPLEMSDEEMKTCDGLIHGICY